MKPTKNEFQNACENLKEDLQNELKVFYDRIKCALDIAAPTCELIEDETEFERFLYCSWCEEDLSLYIHSEKRFEDFKYCPYCGAKITKRRKGERDE